MVILAAAAIPGMLGAFGTLYGIGKETASIGAKVNEFVDDHIDEMKGKENPTIARAGRILEGVKCGFGIGYIAPVVVICTGQLLLGNQMAAIGTAASALTLSNPIAMTCAAVGAVYYGWAALSEQERGELTEKICKGLDVGVELVKSIIRFVVEKAKELFSSKNLEEIKTFITSAAEVFGQTLGDVTHKISDVVSDTYKDVMGKASDAVDKTVEMTQQAYEAAKDTAEKAAHGTKETIDKFMASKKMGSKDDMSE